MRDFWKTSLGILLIAGVAFGIGLGYGRRTARMPARLRVVNDTVQVTKTDTIWREKPVFVASSVIRHDTVRLATLERDTVFVDVPIERRVYEEDSLYRAVVSGWHPSLDTLMVFPKTTTITIRETVPVPDRRRWGIGIQAGAGATRNGLTPYIGVGVSYNLLTW